MSKRNTLAQTPPLGWNSWDCYGTTVREAEVKANADFMAQHLSRFGWSYIVVDIQWYEPNAKAGGYRPNAELITDGFGRLLPATNRFPSAPNGSGFKPLADYVHALGLKFGIHIMRGIPRQAVRQNLPVLNTAFRAQDVADTNSVCPWNDDMFGLDMSKPGAQAYYDSLVALYASWGVDYIKADDMLAPYHEAEIAALSNAIAHTGRPIVLSLSPGVDLSTDHAPHLQQHCDLFRISADFWDRWIDLKEQFDICKTWQAFTVPGCRADADMLPLGRIGIRAERGVDRSSLLTPDEQITLISLWSIFCSPLMMGGDLPTSDAFTLGLLTNAEVLSVNQASHNNREFYRSGDQIAWAANSTNSQDCYLALFNIGDVETTMTLDLAGLEHGESFAVRDLWAKTEIGDVKASLTQTIQPHASKLFRLRPQQP